MSDPEPVGAVEQLRSKLHEASEHAARCQDLAREAADKLISAPSVSLVHARDLARAEAEVADLEVERVRKDLAQAEREAVEAAIAEALASAGPIQDRARQADEAIWQSLAAHEGALQAKLAARTELQRVNARLYQLGYSGHELQVGVRPRTLWTCLYPPNETRQLNGVIRATAMVKVRLALVRFQPTLAVDPLEVADQVDPEVPPGGSDGRPRLLA